MTKAVSVTKFNHTVFGEIRGGEIDGEPHFVGSDLATVLGYTKPADAIWRLVPERHKLQMRLDEADNSSVKRRGNPNRTLVDEAGMYRLIFHSKLKAAEDFVEWVTADVLPTLRRTGTYSTGARLMAPEVQALMDGKSDDEVRIALEQYDRRVAGNAKRKATNAAKKAKRYAT